MFGQNKSQLPTWIGRFNAKIFGMGGYRFILYSNERRPIHVHVRYGGGEAVFDVEYSVELRESQGLKVRELTRAEASEAEILSRESKLIKVANQWNVENHYGPLINVRR